MNAIDWNSSLTTLGLAGFIAALALALGWVQFVRSGRRLHVAVLEGLRALIVFALALTLLQPEVTQELDRVDEPVVAALMDRSGSMTTADTSTPEGFISREAWIDQTVSDAPWASLPSATRVSVEDFAAAPEDANGLEGTDINAALDSILERESALRAVILFTDGSWNLGPSPVAAALRYRATGVPIYSVAVGRETPLPDLSIPEVSPPTYGLLGEQIAIPFRIRSSLPREVQTQVTLTTSAGEEVTKDIVLQPGVELQDAILWYPEEEGVTQLTLSVPVEADEAIADNNEEAFEIQIRMETLKALIVDSLPRWEYRYLRNALERDPGVDMRCMLFHPEIGVGGGRNYLNTFPSDKETIGAYDVIFLGDVGIGEGELTMEQAELIRGLVESQAGGLVFTPGRRGRLLSLVDSPLGDLLPVSLDPDAPTGVPLNNETPLTLTQKGSRHLLTRFETQQEDNAELWQRLPGFFWSAPVMKSRPGAEVLGVHGSLRNEWGRLPVLVTRPFGSGNTLFMGTDAAWRWRRGVEDKYHYRLWSQVTRWMAHKRNQAEGDGIRANLSPESPSVGDEVFLQATILDESGFPIEYGDAQARFTAPSGSVERIQLRSVEGGWGVFQGQFEPEEAGRYQLVVESLEHGRRLEAEFAVTAPRLEKVGEPVDAAILREIARMTGGRTFGVDGVEELMATIQALPERESIDKRVRIWSHPAWGGALLLALAVYWTGRKLTGMV